MRGQGFLAVRPGSHISARAQEFLLSEACRVDGRVALLEAVYVVIAIHMGRGGVVSQIKHSELRVVAQWADHQSQQPIGCSWIRSVWRRFSH